jgi:3-deoxy-7-phosphoheptulonate synthase
MTYTGEVAPGGPADSREAGDLVITKVAVDAEMSNNCYLLRCASTGDQVLIDAAAEPDTLLSLLKTVGRIGKPVLLKRGMAATITDLLLSAEYIFAEGNEQVILCERGVRTFDPATRNMFDLTAIPTVHRLSHLPIIADPSHGTGIRDRVTPMARAAVAAGADGVIVEMHPHPDTALSDGAQSLYPDQLASLIQELRAVAIAIGRRVTAPGTLEARAGTQ